MYNLGIFLTDASFDKKTGVSSISFIEKETGKTNNFQTNKIDNIYEAESEGIKISIKYAFKKYSNIIIVCDNKAAVFNAKKKYFNSMKLTDRFNSVQFLWLPRDFLAEADFLTKNINNEDLNKKLKVEGIQKKSVNVFDIFVSKEEIRDIYIKKGKNVLDIKNIDLMKLKSKSLLFLILEDISSQNKIPNVDSEELKKDILYILELEPKEGKKGSNLQSIVDYLLSI